MRNQRVKGPAKVLPGRGLASRPGNGGVDTRLELFDGWEPSAMMTRQPRKVFEAAGAWRIAGDCGRPDVGDMTARSTAPRRADWMDETGLRSPRASRIGTRLRGTRYPRPAAHS